MNVLKILTEAFNLVRQIIKWVDQGVSDEEIRKRLAKPGSVAQKLIDAAKVREDKIDSFIENG